MANGKTPTGRNGPFTKAQNEVIERSFPEWHEFSLVKNPDCGGRGTNSKLTEWKKKEAHKIMKNIAFEVLPDGFDYRQTFEAILRKFSNYRASRKRMMENGNAEVEALKALAAALLDLKTYSGGRTLFRKRNNQQIKEKKESLLAADPDLGSIGAFQKAQKVLWDEADQDLWEAKAVAEGRDIYENQKKFPDILLSSLRAVCQAGGLGNTEMLLVSVFRNSAGRITTSILEGHHSDEVRPFVDYDPVIEDLRATYEVWAEETIPQVNNSALKVDGVDHAIGRNAKGLPVFPLLDLDDERPGIVRQVIDAYFGYLWDVCLPDGGPIPWDEVVQAPERFYETNLFHFPIPLKHPSRLTNVEAVGLATYLLSTSCAAADHPFEFRRTIPKKRDRSLEILDFTASRLSPSSNASKNEEVESPAHASRSPTPTPSHKAVDPCSARYPIPPEPTEKEREGLERTSAPPPPPSPSRIDLQTSTLLSSKPDTSSQDHHSPPNPTPSPPVTRESGGAHAVEKVPSDVASSPPSQTPAAGIQDIPSSATTAAIDKEIANDHRTTTTTTSTIDHSGGVGMTASDVPHSGPDTTQLMDTASAIPPTHSDIPPTPHRIDFDAIQDGVDASPPPPLTPSPNALGQQTGKARGRNKRKNAASETVAGSDRDRSKKRKTVATRHVEPQAITSNGARRPRRGAERHSHAKGPSSTNTSHTTRVSLMDITDGSRVTLKDGRTGIVAFDKRYMGFYFHHDHDGSEQASIWYDVDISAMINNPMSV